MNENPYRSPEPVEEEWPGKVPWWEKNLTPEKVCWRMGWAAVGLRWLWWNVLLAAVLAVPVGVIGLVRFELTSGLFFHVASVPVMMLVFTAGFFLFMPVRIMGNALGCLFATEMIALYLLNLCNPGVKAPEYLGEHGQMICLLVTVAGFWLSLVPFAYFLLAFAKKMENEAYIARAGRLRGAAVGMTVYAAVFGAFWAAGTYGFFPGPSDGNMCGLVIPVQAVVGLFYAWYTLPILAAARRWVRETFTVENLREKGEFGEFVE